jgi:flagellar basal-body rod modification protein FlgD
MSLTGTPGTTIQPTNNTTTGGLGGTNSSTPSNPLGQNAFLQLMMTQLKDQDPLNPSDPTQYLGELAQMTSVEQQTNIAQSMTQSVSEQNATTALSLLGHTVSYVDSNGNTQTGLVQKVDFTGSGPALTVAGVGNIDPGSVNEVS